MRRTDSLSHNTAFLFCKPLKHILNFCSVHSLIQVETILRNIDIFDLSTVDAHTLAECIKTFLWQIEVGAMG